MATLRCWKFTVALVMTAAALTLGCPAWADAPAPAASPAPAAAHARETCCKQMGKAACHARMSRADCAKQGATCACHAAKKKLTADQRWHIYHRGDNDKDRYVNEWGRFDAQITHPTGWYSHDSDPHNPMW